MAITKTEVVSVRVPPDVKSALVAAAEQERRSLASMVEFMVLDYCKNRSIPLPTSGAEFADRHSLSLKNDKTKRP